MSKGKNKDKGKHVAIGDLCKQELLGCDPIADSPGNYSTIKDRLCLTLALFRSMAIADHINEQIEEESEDLPVRQHEYIINELQHEYRIASFFEKSNPGYEERVLEIYGRWLEKRLPASIIKEVLAKTRSNRKKRDRTAP